MSSGSGSTPTRTLAFLALATFASAVSLRAADPILPEIATSFSTTPGDAAKIVTFFGVAYATAQFAYGLLGDRFGKLRTVAVTTILSGISTLLCAVAVSLEFLILARVAVGLTAASIVTLSFAWLGDVIAYEQRQSVLARFLSGQIIGMVLGQAVSGIIAEHFGWRYVFVAIASVFLVAGTAVALELRRLGSEPTEVGEPLGETTARIGAMLRRRWVAIVLVTTFFEGMLFFGAFTFVGSHLWARFGLNFDVIGLIVAGFGIGALAYSAAAKQLVSRLGETGLVTWGVALVAIAFAAIAAAPTPIAVVPATILAGLGYYMFHNTLQTHATQMAPETRGAAVGAFSSGLFMGQAVGVAIAGPIFDNTGGVPIFLVAGVLLAILGYAFRLCLVRNR